VAPSGSNGNNYQLLKTSRVTATGTTADTSTDTATAIDTATDSDCNCNCNLGFYEETLIFQTSNFEILIQGLDALS
jgi:hypothetical protein